MKTNKELDSLKQRIEKLSNEIRELDDEELGSVTGGNIFIFGGPRIFTNNASEMLTGKVSGVTIAGDGKPNNQDPRVTIRGYSSFNGNNQPLFVVDGVPYYYDFGIRPEDIK